VFAGTASVVRVTSAAARASVIAGANVPGAIHEVTSVGSAGEREPVAVVLVEVVLDVAVELVVELLVVVTGTGGE
jgi:hypothetical protein